MALALALGKNRKTGTARNLSESRSHAASAKVQAACSAKSPINPSRNNQAMKEQHIWMISFFRSGVRLPAIGVSEVDAKEWLNHVRANYPRVTVSEETEVKTMHRVKHFTHWLRIEQLPEFKS